MAVTFTEVERLQNVLNEALTSEWEAQGHSMTNAVVKEIEYQIKQTTDTLTLLGFMPFYGNIIASGTPESKIPYSGRTGRGGTSKYIQALQNYVKIRMSVNDEKKSLSIAFAIAASQKKHGMPTPRSYSFSKSGKRRDWIEEAFKNGEDNIREAISDMAFNMLTVNLDVFLAKWQLLMNEKN